RTTKLFMQVAQERGDFLGLDVMVEELEVEVQSQCPRRYRQGSHHAPTIVSIPTSNHGRLTARGPGATHKRLQHQARFIEKQQASFSCSPLFLAGAKSRCATWRSLLHRAHAPVARASEGSSPV